MRFAPTLLLVPFLFATFAVVFDPPRRASACSGGIEGGWKEVISYMYRSEGVLGVTLAEVTESRRLWDNDKRPVTADGIPMLIPDVATVSTFKPYIYWSNTPFAGNTVGPLGYVFPDCSGGPSLYPGDRVLMFLTKPRYPVADYSIGALGNTIVFRGDEALLMLSGDYTTPAATTREVIEHLLSIAGSPETTSGPARAFAGLQ